MKVATKGRCYELAFRFLLEQQEGELVHGSVETDSRRIDHAWVELPTGYVYEPENEIFFPLAFFKKALKPKEDNRYNLEQAARMAVRTGNYGWWTEQERERWLTK